MHHITIRDQVCNVMASLTKTFFSVPRLSCNSLTRSLLAAAEPKRARGQPGRPSRFGRRWIRSQTDSQSHVSCVYMLSLSADRWEPHDTTASHCNASICFAWAVARCFSWLQNSKVAVVLLAHPFLHTSVMTLVIAVMFFSSK